jgi:hypothetical protein
MSDSDSDDGGAPVNEVVDKIRTLERQIHQNALHLNNIVPLLEFCADDEDEVAYAALWACKRVFAHLQQNKRFSPFLLPKPLWVCVSNTTTTMTMLKLKL